MKKKSLKRLGILMITGLLLAGCGAQTASNVTSASESTLQEGKNDQDTEDGTSAGDQNPASEQKEENTMPNNPIDEAIALETSKVDDAPVEATTEEERIPTAEISDKIPIKYINLRVTDCGKIEKITYTSYDYFGDGGEVEKAANIYLPAGYDPAKQYNVLYLMHGIGGDENEWGMTGSTSRVKCIMDNLSYYGDIESFIVVTPNGRSAANHAANGSDFNSFYVFGQELRNDLMPYIESHYSTYASEALAKAGLDAITNQTGDAEADKAAYAAQKAGADKEAINKALQDSRDHRAMAGLSMGGMQTINIGIGECVDLISYFGAFSAAPTSNPAAKTNGILKDNTYPIHYFYNICGTEDGIAYASASAAAKTLPIVCDQFVDGENFMWQELPGNHDFNIWYLGFYNFAQIAFK
ncbi:MAG: hypothetical protein E7295_16120 [Lachnospiraceae bacterium]|jgi:enterochelin esterase-like enzyme|nr:hypothetical protein [Lachnospiraceae bacterium]